MIIEKSQEHYLLLKRVFCWKPNNRRFESEKIVNLDAGNSSSDPGIFLRL